MQVRVYLTGRMAVETSAGIADEAQFPGRQGRLAFAFLGLSAQRPVARDALADAIWGPELPAAWESALKSIMSKLRSLLKTVGLSDAVASVSGCYQLRLPVESWIDLEAAVRAVDVAEGAIRRNVIDEAWSEATVATAIAAPAVAAGRGCTMDRRCTSAVDRDARPCARGAGAGLAATPQRAARDGGFSGGCRPRAVS